MKHALKISLDEFLEVSSDLSGGYFGVIAVRTLPKIFTGVLIRNHARIPKGISSGIPIRRIILTSIS